jgi:hypothetical protein
VSRCFCVVLVGTFVPMHWVMIQTTFQFLCGLSFLAPYTSYSSYPISMELGKNEKYLILSGDRVKNQRLGR